MNNKKEDMAKVKNIINNETLEQHLELLKMLCDIYDEAIRDKIAIYIAVNLRTLLHDTEHSHSLLKHLGKKGKAQFISTNSVKNDKDNVILGLVRRINVGVNDGIGGEAKYWPLCDERYFPMRCEIKKLQFEQWWNEEIFICDGHSLTRKDLILSVCNKDGGAHFDEEVSNKYDVFRHAWSGSSSLVGRNSGAIRGYDNIPTFPAVRQIAYEILLTFNYEIG